jgi:hypothetical protein
VTAPESPPRPPATIPPVPAGAVLQLRAEDWEYGDRPLVFEVEAAMPEISGYQHGKVWLRGHEIHHRRAYRMFVLVPISLLARRS